MSRCGFRLSTADRRWTHRRGRSPFWRAIGLLCGVAALLATGRARAYCLEVTESPPAGYNPAQQGCFSANPDGGQALPSLFWRNQCLGYSLQKNASKWISLGDAERIAYQAFTAWSNVACPGGGSPSITASALTPVDCDSVPSQLHNNVIMFRDNGWPYDDTSNAIGFTTLTVCIQPPCPGDPNALPGEILGADTEINSTVYTIVAEATPDAGSNVYDLPSILTHEAGHFLGLAHSTDTSAVMYAFYHPGSTVPQPDDVAGICAIYAPNGSRNTQSGNIAGTSCNTAPLLGLEDGCGSIDAGPPGSGALDGGVATDPQSNGDTLFGCTLGPPPRSGVGGFAALGVLVLGGLAGARRISRRARSWVARAGLLLALLGPLMAGLRTAGASISVVLSFEDLVRRATAVAVVMPVESHALWEDGRIVTYTRVHVERQVAGRLAAEEVWIRALGGDVGHIGHRVEGQATFALGSPSLVFLHPHLDPVSGAASGTFGVVEGAQGQYPIVHGDGGRTMLATAQNVGTLVLPRGDSAARLARDVLRDRALDDAAREIASAWALAH